MANAIDYLLKPFSKERFDKAIAKYKESPLSAPELSNLTAAQPTARIVIRDSGKIRIIPYGEISVIQADDDYVKIHTVNGSFMRKATLGFYENRLPPVQFVGVHRSYLVNTNEITRIEPYEKTSHVAVLKDGQRIQVSKSGYQRLC